MNFSKWLKGLRGKLLTLASLPILLTAALVGVALYGIGSLRSDIESAIDQEIPSALALGDMNAALMTMVVNLWETANTPISDPNLRNRFLKEAQGELENFKSSYEAFSKYDMDSEEKIIYQDLKSNLDRLNPLIEKTFSLLKQSNDESNEQAKRILSRELSEALDPVDKCFSDFVDSQKKSLRVSEKDSDNLVSNITWTLYSSAAAGLFCILFVALYLAVRISSRLNEVSMHLASSATSVSSATSQVSLSGQELSKSTTESASSLQETVASLEELSSLVKQNAEHAKDASTLSQKSRDSALHGEKEISNLIASMTEIAQGSKKIEEIIKVIDDITFQTNLLALNAAVEAARAGEQGKGFAVVAEAVRSLAQKSAEAAKDINLLIKANVDLSERGASIADRSRVVLSDIVQSIKQIANLNSEIAAAGTEQTLGLEQISKAMNQIDSTTQVNATSAEQIALSATTMTQEAHLLDKLVKKLELIIEGDSSQAVVRSIDVGGSSDNFSYKQLEPELKSSFFPNGSEPSPLHPTKEKEIRLRKLGDF